MPNTIQELSYDTQLIARRLATAKQGEVVTYQELSKIIGKDVRAGKRHVLNSARNIVRRDNKIVFGTVRGEGVKRLDDSEVLNGATPYLRKRMRAATRRVKNEIGTVDNTSLTQDQRMQRDMSIVLIGLTETITSSKSVERLEAKVRSASELPSMGDAFAIMSS